VRTASDAMRDARREAFARWLGRRTAAAVAMRIGFDLPTRRLVGRGHFFGEAAGALAGFSASEAFAAFAAAFEHFR